MISQQEAQSQTPAWSTTRTPIRTVHHPQPPTVEQNQLEQALVNPKKQQPFAAEISDHWEAFFTQLVSV